MTNTANDRAWYDARTACLSEFMTAERIAVFERVLDMRTRYMTILTENTYHPQNAAALVRHCEAFGVQEMHTVETVCRFTPSAATALRPASKRSYSAMLLETFSPR